MLWLTVNRGCNLRCAWCYAAASAYASEDQIPLSMALDLVRMAKELKVGRLLLIGGEPTLWPHLFELNDAIAEAGLASTLVTNAHRFASDRFWNDYQAHSNTSIGASIKAYSRQSLQENAGAHSFDEITRGLKRVFEHQPRSVASFVYSRPYVGHLLDMVKYAVDCGAFAVSVNFCSPAIHSDHVDDRFMVEVDVMIDEIVSSYDEANEIAGGRLVFVMKHPLCLWPAPFVETLKARGQIATTCHLQHQSGAIIDTDGSLLLCNSLFEFPVGRFGQDFDSSETLKTFFASDGVSRYFRQAKSYPSTKCIGCDAYADCGGGCPILWSAYAPEKLIPGLSSRAVR